jgi:chaperonin GroES
VLKWRAEALEVEEGATRSLVRDASVGLRPRFGSEAGYRAKGLNKFVLERRTSMTFRPLHDRILVRRIEPQEKTTGGVIIPDTAKEKPQEGEVIAAGPGARNESGQLEPLDVKVGDRILFGKWSGNEIRLDGEDLLIMKESDVMGVIEVAASVKKAA